MEKRSGTNNKTSTSQMHANTIWCLFFYFVAFAEPLFLLLLIRTHSFSPFQYIYFETDFPCYFCSFYISRSCSTSIRVFHLHSFIHCIPFDACHCSMLLFFASHTCFVANAPFCACSLDAEHHTEQFSCRHISLLTPFLLRHGTFSRISPEPRHGMFVRATCVTRVCGNIFLLIFFSVPIFRFKRETVL